MSQAKFKAAAVHAAPVYMNKKATIEKTIRLIEQAGDQSIELLVFPETFIPGYPYFIECYPPLEAVSVLVQYAEQSMSISETSEDLTLIQSACKEFNVAVSLGISERVAGGYTLFNSQVHIDTNGALLGVHRKLQPTYVERAIWAQGSGHTLRTYRTEGGYNLGGLCCWENTMNGARQALIEDAQHVHAGAWPALSTMAGFETGADAQIEALMKAHALTGQVFVICASNYVDDTCLNWMKENIGEQKYVKKGGGWSAIIHPFCMFLAQPHTGEEENLVTAEIDLAQLAQVKVWVDAAGHYKRPEVLSFGVEKKPLWDDEEKIAGGRNRRMDVVERSVKKGKVSQKGAMPRWDESAWD
ncbi:MAG: hypothetical protein M1827_000377 [Pycnora praestabilis]|nr:MAG: hypothetical protein M1827_000377 [Pycnora praestabilis]